MKKIKILKQELKELAVEIRKLRKTRKSEPYGYVPGLESLSSEARHKHIVYCMLRGRRYEEIEPKCHNAPSTILLEMLMEDYSEDVCTGT